MDHDVGVADNGQISDNPCEAEKEQDTEGVLESPDSLAALQVLPYFLLCDCGLRYLAHDEAKYDDVEDENNGHWDKKASYQRPFLKEAA